ncbi:MAG: DUF5330 domain-containing protein [Bauldia sp.]
MFLIRAAFWLTLAVMFIPADPMTGTEAPRVGALQALGAAQATVADLSSFCERNPDVCITGNAAFRVFSEKAQNGARMIYRYFDSTAGEETKDSAKSGTLRGEDRAPAWRSPRAPGAA